VDRLEDRTLMSGSSGGGSSLLPADAPPRTPNEPAPASGSTAPVGPAQVPPPGKLTPPHIILRSGLPSPDPAAITPAQMKHAYCIDQIFYGGLPAQGAGQTIAIIAANDNPSLIGTNDPNFVNSDLHQFDLQFGLPDPPSFIKINTSGGTVLPPANPVGSAFNTEADLDVEWAHALAPKANIILVEGLVTDTTSPFDFFAATVGEARSIPQVSVVSMSFTFAANGLPAEDPGEMALDPVFTTPAGHQGITFLGSTGDFGAPGGYPAYSPNVVAVGGTTLNIDAQGNYIGETGWGNGAASSTLGGSGGGISQFEREPAFQRSVQNTGFRTIPDVSMDADPATGVPVYDAFDNPGSGPWETVGGTSLSCPMWAALISIADEGRILIGQGTLDGPTQTLPQLYALPKTDFHDIVSGNNGFPAGPGYDLVTGIGSPVACRLIPDLVGPIPGATVTGTQTHRPIRYIFADTPDQLFDGTLVLSNTTSQAITGNFAVLLQDLPPAVTVMLPTPPPATTSPDVSLISTTLGTFEGAPFISLTGTLPANGSVRVALRFKNPNGQFLSTFSEGYTVGLFFEGDTDND
jgi:subtilase family serine protease